jgi:uncharacterized membrane protein
MKPFFVLILVFVISLVITSLLSTMNLMLSGKIAMSVMLLFTSIGHFKFADGMTMMLPKRMPAKKVVIWITGIFEILAAAGILISSAAWLTGVLLIIFFVLILPSNIAAAIRHVNYEKADYSGKGVEYLWFRVPFQLLLIGWVYFFVIRPYHILT